MKRRRAGLRSHILVIVAIGLRKQTPRDA